MTQRLTSTSPRLAAAQAFGALLTKRMAELEVGQRVVKEAAGVSRASVVEWRNGRNLPTLEVGLRVAEALNEPRLAEIVRRGRTIECRRCGRPFVNEAGLPKRYCSAACRCLGGVKPPEETEAAVMVLRGELLRMGPARKQRIGKALTMLDDALQPGRAALEGLEAYQDAVAEMCGTCEPEGLCRTPECPLRSVSPLPLASAEAREVTTAAKPPGRWGQPGAHERASDQLRERWQEPGRKEAQGARTRAAWAAMTDEERAAAGRLISERRRAQPAEITGGLTVKRDRQLTLGQLLEVRQAADRGADRRELARAYRVSIRTIYRAIEGRIEEGAIGGHRVVMQLIDGQPPRILARPLLGETA